MPKRTLAILLLAILSAAGLAYLLLDTAAEPAAGPELSGWMQAFTPAENPTGAPTAPFINEANKPHLIADFKGRVLLVNFWATWCAPCIRELPSLDRLQTRLGGDDFSVLALSQDRKGWPVITPFLPRVDIPNLPLFWDKGGRFAAALEVTSLPATYVIDRQGKVRGRLIGPAEWDSPEAEALIRFYMDEK